MGNFNQLHYKELRGLLTHLRKLRNCNHLYEKIFNDDEFRGSYILTVGDGIGYSLNSGEGTEIINALADNDYLTLIDNPNEESAAGAVRYYLINDYDYLLERLSILIEELMP
jgi:hypothetical protein